MNKNIKYRKYNKKKYINKNEKKIYNKQENYFSLFLKTPKQVIF